MIYCQIKENIVTNRAVFDAAMPSDWPEHETYVQNDEAQIGWSYAGGSFTPPEPLPAVLPPPSTPTAEQTAIYKHENRIRALEGQPPLSLADFVARELS